MSVNASVSCVNWSTPLQKKKTRSGICALASRLRQQLPSVGRPLPSNESPLRNANRHHSTANPSGLQQTQKNRNAQKAWHANTALEARTAALQGQRKIESVGYDCCCCCCSCCWWWSRRIRGCTDRHVGVDSFLQLFSAKWFQNAECGCSTKARMMLWKLCPT